MEAEKLKKLAEDNGLVKDDFFILQLGSKKIPIIKREGIEKIQVNKGISVNYEVISISDDHKYCIIKAIAQVSVKDSPIKQFESYGESSPTNCKQSYPIAMAEKRALSRVVLKAAGLYSEGIFGEDEAEDFKQNNNDRVGNIKGNG